LKGELSNVMPPGAISKINPKSKKKRGIYVKPHYSCDE
jgi:hypothetical protein